jgi:putative intracellular protease/amidase
MWPAPRKGRQATCYPSQAGTLKRGGAVVLEQRVVKDGRMITADGPESAAAFARVVAEALE